MRSPHTQHPGCPLLPLMTPLHTAQHKTPKSASGDTIPKDDQKQLSLRADKREWSSLRVSPAKTERTSPWSLASPPAPGGPCL